MKGFRPEPHYVREMKKHGILARNLPENAEIDVYATDREAMAAAVVQITDFEGVLVIPNK